MTLAAFWNETAGVTAVEYSLMMIIGGGTMFTLFSAYQQSLITMLAAVNDIIAVVQ
ncbi:MAG: hypothetical protein ACON5B_17635 [Myxococcota bacterium]